MKSYSDSKLRKSSTRSMYSMYKSTHPLFGKWMKQKHKSIHKDEIDNSILQLIDNKRSLWIDSFGYCLHSYNPKIISVEDVLFLPLLKGVSNVYCRADLHNHMTHMELSKTYDPEIVVYFKSPYFKYLTLSELTEAITDIQKTYNKSVCVYLDMIFLKYNKMKYPINDIVNQISNSLPGSTLKRFRLTDLLINI